MMTMIRCTEPLDAAQMLVTNWLEIRGFALIAPQSIGAFNTVLLRAESASTKVLAALCVARFPDRAETLSAMAFERFANLADDEHRDLLELRVQVDYFGHASAPVQCVRHARRDVGVAQAAA